MNNHELIRKFVFTELVGSDDCQELNDTESLIDSGMIDSLGVMKLITYLEETFDINIDADDITPENFETIQEISLMVQKKINS